ncbi:MAG: hypothetical protein ABIA97_06065 [Candidatus Omnitrophota bacterium]
MRRILVFMVVALFVMGVVSIAMAQEAETGTETSASMVKSEEGMMGMGKMKDKMMQHGKDKGWDKMSMMKQMMQKQIVATEDGGVIVLTGNKLLKYDKNLNLKKEAEIPMDMGGMHKRMMQMMKECPMKDKMQESAEIEESQ